MHGWSDLNRCKLLEANDENGKGYRPSSPSSHLLPSQGSVIQVMELQVVRQLLGPELSGSCQAVVRKLSGSCKTVIWLNLPSGSSRQSSAAALKNGKGYHPSF